MKKIVFVICVFFSLFMAGCQSFKEEFDIIENNIKSSIPESIEEDIVLPTEDLTYNATISWKSSNEEVLTSVGENKNKLLKTDVTLTYTINIKNKQREGVIVIAVNANKYLLQLDVVEEKILFEIPEETDHDLKLLKEVSEYDAQIEWKSSNEEIFTSTGVNNNKTGEAIDVILSYVIKIGDYKKEGIKQVKVLHSIEDLIANEIEERIKNSIPKSTLKDIMLLRSVPEYWVNIEWESSNENVISKAGRVLNIDENPVVVTLTYRFKINDEKREGTIQVEVPCTENYEFRLEYEKYYIGDINQDFSLTGKIYKNGEVFNAYFPKIIIEGNYDTTIPGEYDLTGSIEFKSENIDKEGNTVVKIIGLKDTFKLIVLTPNEATFEEYSKEKYDSVEYSFGFDHYYIICPVDSLIIYDLNDPTAYKTISINGRCNSHYYKEGYLYISSVDPYEDKYSDNFTGSISKIDLKNATLVEEIRVNSAPDSIVVDKRNNIIISKEQNQHVSIDYLDMKTKEISIMCYGYYGDELIYNEQDDMVMIVSKASTTDPNIYKYNEESETFELFEMFYELNPLVMAPDIFGRNGNSFIYGSQLYTKAYAEFINGEAQAKKIDIINQKLSWSALYEVCITDNNLVIMQYCPIDLKAGTSFCYITVYDRETTKYQTYQKITNYNGNQLGGIYMYNGNIYVFDKKLGKILVTN